MSKEFVFNDDQVASIEDIAEFSTDMFSRSWYYVFTGPAGSGKTACMEEVASKMKSLGLRIVFTAPTNKAAKVLRGVVGDAQTTYSFLNLRVAKDGEIKRITQGKDPDLSHLDVLCVDEASMVNRELFNYLKEAAVKWGFKVVFMGDPFQLPPVNEDESLALSGECSTSLTKVVRHDNQILKLATRIRRHMDMDDASIRIENDNDGEQGVWVVGQDDFKMMLYLAAKEGDFNDGETAKAVAWRNSQVDHYNNIIRHGIFGKKAKPGYFLINERISAGTPCVWGELPLLHTDDSGLVIDINERRHPHYDDFKVFELMVETDATKKPIKLTVIHPDSADDLDYHFYDFSNRAKKAPALWKEFWEMKEYFHDVRYGYAETAHKSQGSTYRDVYVDSTDIMINRKTTESLRCLYVACTRPTTRLTVL